eukprot:Rmarinus@m.21727
MLGFLQCSQPYASMPNTCANRAERKTIVLFDVMSTLVEDPFHDVVKSFFNMTLKEFYSKTNPQTWIQFELGLVDETYLSTNYLKDGSFLDVEKMKKATQVRYRYVDGMERVLTLLREARVEVHIASNYPIWYKLVEDTVGLSKYVPWSFVSCDIGVRKPDPGFFKFIQKQLNRPAMEMILVDDKEENCEAALLMGMKAFHFRSECPKSRFSDPSSPMLRLAPLSNFSTATCSGGPEDLLVFLNEELKL